MANNVKQYNETILNCRLTCTTVTFNADLRYNTSMAKSSPKSSRFFLYLCGVLAAGLSLTYLCATLQLPNVDKLKAVHLQVPLRVYTADKKLIAQFGTKRRIPVHLSEIPADLVNAILATEDARFYQHGGVDLIGILRATLAVALSGKKTQGASTITMQVARNFYLSPEKTYIRKIKEILLALKIDRELTKDTILELYLNKIYFGNRAYGVAAAAQIYYGKALSDLTLAEMAMLAGLPQAPSRNNPIEKPDVALKRRNHVLMRMREVGFISEKQYQHAIVTRDTAHLHHDAIQISAPYLAEMVREAMIEEYGKEAYEKGLSVYTTVDSTLQKFANDALQEGLLRYKKRHHQAEDIQGAIVSLRPQDGAISAISGGFDYQRSTFNRAIQASRQPGSNFKPFIYSAALNKGFTLASMINDAPIVVQQGKGEDLWRPTNDNLKFYGPTSLRTALINSRNVVSIRLLHSIGIPYAIEYVQRFGFDAHQLPPTLSLALGAGSATPLQLAVAYAVFANGGYLVTPYFIEKIADQRGKILYAANPTRAGPSAPRVISAQNAYLMTQVLQDVIQHGTAQAAKALGRHDLAGKTGSTNDHADAWFSGFNSHIVTTVWVGFDNMRNLHEYGATAALPIWMQFMRNALAGSPEATLSEPPGIVRARIDPQTGLLAAPSQPNTLFEIFSQKYMPRTRSDAEMQEDNIEDTDSHF